MLRIITRDTDRLMLKTVDSVTTLSSESVTPSAVWYDLVSPTAEEDRFVETCLGISLPTREEAQEIEISSRLYNEDGAEFLTLTLVSGLDTENPSKTPVTFVLKGERLVTVRYTDPRPFASVYSRMQRASAISYATGETIMLSLVEAIIDRLADVLEGVGGEIDQISHEVFGARAGNASRQTRNLQGLIERIGRKGDLLTLARESLVSIARMATYHQALELDGRKLGKDVRSRIKIIQRDVTSLSDHAAFLSNKINFMLDATLGLINLEQNQIIKIFSVAAVVFLPPTLVASIYGMNFDVMPELKWRLGYPWALGLMVLSAILPFLYFKRRGWL
jgi:magnesium transporter